VTGAEAWKRSRERSGRGKGAAKEKIKKPGRLHQESVVEDQRRGSERYVGGSGAEGIRP